MLITLHASEVAIALLLGVTGILVVATLQKKRRTKLLSKKGVPLKLPPGPPARWFWENIIPIVNTSSTFNSLANEYGSVFTLRQGNEIAIVIARVDAAAEIMEKEGSALADRPRQIAVNEFLSGTNRITLLSNGERFRRLRKTVHTHFQPKAVVTYKDIQSEHAKTFILGLLDNPNNHEKHAHQYSTSVILRITYGKTSPTSVDDPEFVRVKEVLSHFIEGLRPGGYLVDRFPWLKYVPGYGRRLKGFYESDLEFYKAQLNRVKAELSSGDAGPSFGRMLLENAEGSFDEMAFLAGTLFEAGSDTTADTLIVITMAAACFPEAQLRVQEELDKVIGMDRLPSWSDWDALPQLHAFISEAFRWRPITPLGFAHQASRDIIWGDYYIPAGTPVHANLWAISRDPIAFPDPEKFDPQRWFDNNGQLRKDIDCYPFGFGRRICPGIHLANRSIFIATALLFWSFRIAARPNAPIDTTPDLDHIVAHLALFEADFVPRIKEAQLREMMLV